MQVAFREEALAVRAVPVALVVPAVGADSGGPGGAAGQMLGGGAAGGPVVRRPRRRSRAAASVAGVVGAPSRSSTPGGGGGPLGRLFRQQVNRIRYSFYDSYQNSAFDARPYAITGTPAPKVGHYDERVGGNMGGPLKIPHIYNGADHTYFFLNYQHETVSNAINTFSTVPTADQRNGCFPAGTVFQPFTTTPVTTQGSCAAGDVQVPIDPVAQSFSISSRCRRQRRAVSTARRIICCKQPRRKTPTA